MIFTDYDNKLFFVDLLLHLLFSFTIATLIFLTKFRKPKQDELNEKVQKVLETNVTSELSTPTTTDKTNLDILKIVYTNRDKFDKILVSDIIKSSYTHLLVFSIPIVITIIFLEDKSKLMNLFFDKLVTFIILGSVIYLYCVHFREQYNEIKEKEIYDMIKKSQKSFKSSTTY